MTSPLSRPRNPLARAGLFWFVFVALLFLQGTLVKPFFPAAAERLVFGLQGLLAVAVAGWLFARRSSQTGPALHPARNFLLGTLAGMAIVAALFLFVCAAGGGRLRSTGAPFGLPELLPYLALVFLAWMEEAAFRGYPFRLLRQRYGLLRTQAIVAAAFAAYHILMGWHPLQALAGPGVWSVLFGVAAARSRGIALPTGLHLGVNVLQALLGGFAGYASPWVVETGTDPQGIQLAGLAAQAVILLLSVGASIRFRKMAALPESTPA
ncbi:MAG: CPBP family intramembrane metalloprotease [Chitinophagaceae bacterium]|nr:MAG: CPBP family intramembrane metalloprotease [Chitinophagaceae bacterium]